MRFRRSTFLVNMILSRPYRIGDFLSCLSIFDSNMPLFFTSEERDDFAAFLANLRGMDNHYLVVTLNEAVVACGGLSFEVGSTSASLTWGMVHSGYHQQGLGKRLTEERLSRARALVGVSDVLLSTSQHTYCFYGRFGFEILKITPDGFGKGLDRYDMALALGET